MNQKQVIIAFILIFLLGAFLRLYDLDRRPIHHDEGVISSFVENILNNGYYEYDPEYHGPVMHYISAFFMIVFGKQDFVLRLGSALLGILTILIIWPMKKYLGDVGMLASAFFIATSPALVYYSRFSFHDVPFVFFYLLFIYLFSQYIDSKNNKFIYLASVAFALMFSIKEVIHTVLPGILLFFFSAALIKGFNENWKSGARIFVDLIPIYLFPLVFYSINAKYFVNFTEKITGIHNSSIYMLISILGVAISVLFLLMYLKRCKTYNCFKEDFKKYVIPTLIVFFISSLVFSLIYTAGFTHIEDGLRRGIGAPIKYIISKIGEPTGHSKPIWYYAKNLFLFESLIFMLSIATVFLRKENQFIKLFVFLSAYNLLIFSVLSYKTPWHIVYIIAPMCIAAGYAVQRAYDLIGKRRKEIFLTIAILFAVAFTFISYQISFIKYADEANIPYVYVQATEEFREMLKYIEISSEQFNGKNTSIDILSEEYWPLPWSLREYKNIAWHAKVIENPTGDIAIGNKVNETELNIKLENYSKREFHNRPGVEFLVYVRTP